LREAGMAEDPIETVHGVGYWSKFRYSPRGVRQWDTNNEDGFGVLSPFSPPWYRQLAPKHRSIPIAIAFPNNYPLLPPLPAAPTAPTPTPNPELGSPEDAKQVSIRSIRVMGSTVLKPQAWDAIVRPLTGKTVTIGDLKATADHLTQLYSSRQDGRDMLQ
jgi:hypothetical protein